MKTILTIAAIAMFAVMLGISAFAPAMAAKADKIDVCHFSEEETVVDADGNEIVVPAEWKVININGNAQNAHVGKHTDGENFDALISDDFTVDECLARNVVTEPAS
jgi:hypothetical protein